MKSDSEVTFERTAHSVSELRKCAAFTGYYTERVQGEIARLADAILNEEMDDRQRENLRQRRLALVEAIGYPDMDFGAAISMLSPASKMRL